MKKVFLQIQLRALIAKGIAFAGLIAFGQSTFAEIPSIGLTLHEQDTEVSGTLLSLENSTDIQEFIAGIGNEIEKIHQDYPQAKVFVHWLDAVRPSTDREPSAAEKPEDIAGEIAGKHNEIEVDGNRIALDTAPQPLTPGQALYVRCATVTAYIIRVGFIGAVEAYHVYVTAHVAPWVIAVAGAATIGGMVFNTYYTENVTNKILYGKWVKELSDEDLKAINGAVKTRLGRVLQLPKMMFNSWVYELIFQGVLQSVIGLASLASGVPFPTNPLAVLGRFGGSTAVGTLGEAAFDQAQRAYQETRAATVPKEVRGANLKLINAFSSSLGVLGVLMASNDTTAGYWALGFMAPTGLVLVAYYRYTEQIHDFVQSGISKIGARTRDFMNGIAGAFKSAREKTCNLLLRRD